MKINKISDSAPVAVTVQDDSPGGGFGYFGKSKAAKGKGKKGKDAKADKKADKK